MSETIIFLNQLDCSEEARWLAHLKQEMADENIITLSTLTPDERKKIEQNTKIAIVASPDIDDIKKFKNLELIHSVWAGVEKLVSCLPKTAAPIIRLVDPELSRTMAEAVLAWCLYIQRDMPHYKTQQNNKIWRPLPYKPANKMRVGIVGLGTLGQASAKLLATVGFQLSGWSKTKKNIEGVTCHNGEDGLNTLLQTSDIVVLLLPLTDETKNLFNEARLANFKKGAALINFARGAIIETNALLQALQDDTLSHAVLDVFINEPVSQNCPYWHHEKVTLLPHISAPTTPESGAKIVAHNIKNWRATKTLPNTQTMVVDRERGY